ncbi:unnamed protein product [Rotaria magnacalcarata]|uniref:Uncharacterized protein n=1 Tax=Rotaria magnacalcarata TaxID=392030 RepID=A0A816Z6Q8_9BILA|nr:unnamed protein product [Rotaria magnacalcarata]
MAAATADRTVCDKCSKAKGISRCEGCSRIFCYNDFIEHRHDLNKQLDDIVINHDIFRQDLTEHKVEPKTRALHQQINDWECDAIEKIRRTAEEVRQILVKHSNDNTIGIETKLSKLTDQLRHGRQENDFVETDLFQWKAQLIQLTEEINNPSNITIRQDSITLVNKISVEISTLPLHMPKINANAGWLQNGITVAGGNQKGDELNQLYFPWGICVDDDEQAMYIADTFNHRIVEWKYGATHGRVLAGGNSSGNRKDQLNEPSNLLLDKENDALIICDQGNRRVMRWPRRNGTQGEIIIENVLCTGIAMDKDKYLYVSECERNEVRKWLMGEKIGTIVAGGRGQGNGFNQLNSPSCIFVDQDYSVYISDEKNHRVMKWIKDATEGIIVAGGQGEGNDLARLSCPRGVIVDPFGTVYVADTKNNRIVRWSKEAEDGTVVVGGNNQGSLQAQLYSPQGLSFDQQGNLYVVDRLNNRIQKFDIVPNSSSQ